MNVFIKENSLIAKLAALCMKQKNMAITINKTIYLYNASKEKFLKDKAWVTHEVVHVYQYKKLGVTRFLLLYIFESIKNGYIIKINLKLRQDNRKKISYYYNK